MPANPKSLAPLAVLPPLKAGDVLIAIDPGYTTGVCVVKYIGKPTPYDFEILESFEIPWASRFLDVSGLLNRRKDALRRLIVEDFVLYENKAQDLIGHGFPSPEFRGVVKTYAFEMGLLHLWMDQLAAVRKSVRVLEEHRPLLAPGQHCLDAYQHARYCIAVEINSARTKAKRKS